ncbi:hypothetical protein PsYK624_014240 [Phanerochaete sordida]|uniref:DUF6533 domain-containing protein n=1 Tax=Phanerochaete sordida TaxID=48140 RepID=A0A9P3L7U0_9APHY|nr:hypothetical protein PsYK624_014240 [Phanerochaete sordida]
MPNNIGDLKVLQGFNIVGSSFAALVLYEHSITLAQEVETIWRRKLTVPSVLLLATRLSLLLFAVTCVMSLSGYQCVISGNIGEIIIAAGYLPVYLFLSFRVFALWTRNWTLFTVVFVLGLTPTITNSLTAAAYTYTPLLGPVTTCLTVIKPWAVSELNRGYTMERFSSWRNARRAKIQVTISECILQDGTVYFVYGLILCLEPTAYSLSQSIMFAINVAQMAIFNDEVGEMLGVYVNGMPLVLGARFMMNLRQASYCSNLLPYSATASVHQTSMLGNIAEPLEFHASQSSGDRF